MQYKLWLLNKIDLHKIVTDVYFSEYPIKRLFHDHQLNINTIFFFILPVFFLLDFKGFF